MFLVTIAKQGLARRLRAVETSEYTIDACCVLTIATDRFLSCLTREPTRFTVAEPAPLAIGGPGSRQLILAATFDQNTGMLELFKSTISGRPLYYYLSPNGEFYCSTHISLLRDAGIAIEENDDVVPEFFVYRYVMPPNTLYKNIKQLLAGSAIRVQIENGKCNITSQDEYAPPAPTFNGRHTNGKEVSGQLLNLLHNSFKELTPVGARLAPLLSGGLDSSILCRICENEFQVNGTHSTAYPFELPANNREKEYAVSAAAALGMNHAFHEINTGDYLRGLVEAIHTAEQPIHHLQSVLLYLLFKRLPKDKDIVICGQGADGVFGLGLHNFIFRSDNMSCKFLLQPPLMQLLAMACKVTGKGQHVLDHLERIKGKYVPLSDPANIVWSLGAYGSEAWIADRYDVSSEQIIGGRYSTIRRFEDRSLYDVISILDFLGDVSTTLSIWSKLAESQGRVIYYPFNHEEILNYVYTIPWNIKLAEPKNILRSVARRLEVPEFIITRPKSSFGIEAKRWAGKGGPFEPLVSLAAKVFDIGEIRAMQNSLDGEKTMTFWNILNYAIWRRLFIENEPLELLLDELNNAPSRDDSTTNATLHSS